MISVGLDAGSVSVKVVVLDAQGGLTRSAYVRHKGQPLIVAQTLLEQVVAGLQSAPNPSIVPHEDISLSVTGSAGRLIGSILEIEPVNEVVAFSFATRTLLPEIRTIIELGGEDSKLILLGEDSRAAQDFAMNSVCAAGTGSFLDQQAERLRLTIEEFGRLSLTPEKPPRIAGRCSVFAKSDMIHLQQIATPVEDIAAGLCFAVARNFKGAIARGRQIEPPVAFLGGVASNPGMVRAFKETFGLTEITVPGEHALMGAIGAAMKDRGSGQVNRFSLDRLTGYLSAQKPAEQGHHPLFTVMDSFGQRHMQADNEAHSAPSFSADKFPIHAWLGVDIGSISTNLAVVDNEGRLLAKRYLMTAGRPIEAVRQGLEEIADELGDRVMIVGVGTTGSGRYMIADYIGADIVKNEITAQATAAAFIDPEVDTIFEIGGQDSKYISLRDGVIVDFEMNKACAAGTGSFLEEQAEKLGISIKGDFERSALCAGSPCRLGERCTVFMENSLTANLQKGTSRDNLLAGLAYSIVQNYINRVVCKRHIGRKIFFQGGVAFNKSVVAAFEKYLDTEIIVPPHHDVTGAIGMALIARDHMAQTPEKPTQFKGFALSRQPYRLSSFTCNGCPNVCEINRVTVEGEKTPLTYGGRCEKYDVRRKKIKHAVPDLFAFREEMLLRPYEAFRSKAREQDKGAKVGSAGQPPRIGIPHIFYFHDQLPYWTTLLGELGFDIELSPKTDRAIIDLGQELALSESCFPVKAALGHIRTLIDQGADALFIPSFVNLNTSADSFGTGFACPYTQTMPYTARVAFPDARIIAPVINYGRGNAYLSKELLNALRPFGVTHLMLAMAMQAAEDAQKEFTERIRDKGGEILSTLATEAVVITGRAYNSFDRGMNLDIPGKLAHLNVLAIPMDMLPLDRQQIQGKWPNMYWRAGQRILSAASIIREHPLLHAVHIGNFSCGPDSFILKFLEEELAGKPYLHLEFDAHSADAGAITRCEAFLDSVRNRMRVSAPAAASSIERSSTAAAPAALRSGNGRRTVYIPNMSDHSPAIASAFRSCGVEAEVLPESTRESVELGQRYVSGKECYPCAVTTGDMVKKALSPGFDPSRAAFFMPSGSGPCRFGQYNVFHRLVLRDMGMADTPVFSPNQDEHFYTELGVIGSSFVRRSWEGIVAVSLLQKCLHETRPYEREKGLADRVFADHIGQTCRSLEGRDGSLQAVLGRARQAFAAIPRSQERRPMIGIVGEIFVRSNRFSNENLIRKIEDLGGQAYLAPVDEWILYINLMGLRRFLIKKEWSGMITLLLKRLLQKRTEHRFGKPFEEFLGILHEPDTKVLLKNAAPYIHPSFEGEAILSIGKSIDLVRRGAAGIVNAMPFGCMPGTIVSGLMRGVSREYGIPYLSIPYDGTESLTTEIQLEAFMDQAQEYIRTRR